MGTGPPGVPSGLPRSSQGTRRVARAQPPTCCPARLRGHRGSVRPGGASYRSDHRPRRARCRGAPQGRRGHLDGTDRGPADDASGHRRRAAPGVRRPPPRRGRPGPDDHARARARPPARAATEVPRANARVRAGRIHPFDEVSIGFAVDIGQGTDLAPCKVSGADQLTPEQMATEVWEGVKALRDGHRPRLHHLDPRRLGRADLPDAADDDGHLDPPRRLGPAAARPAGQPAGLGVHQQRRAAGRRGGLPRAGPLRPDPGLHLARHRHRAGRRARRRRSSPYRSSRSA